jgi:hypothetical protein
MTGPGDENAGSGLPAAILILAAVAVAALTGAEIAIAGGEIARAAKITALVGLLLAKAGVVGFAFMGLALGLPLGRRSARLTLVAVAVAAGYAVVLMLEAAFRARLEG